MGATGTAVLDFGAFPGSSITFVDVATAGVTSTSLVEAWIRPEGTADHTDGDHVVAPIRVVGMFLSPGNIRIWGINTNDVIPPLELQPVLSSTLGWDVRLARQNAPMLVGQYNVNWAWL
jgi:hypothetical protein